MFKGNNSKSRKNRVTVHVFCRSSYGILHFFMYRENITNGIRIIERTRVQGRNGYVQCSKGNNSKSWQIIVLVYVFCTLSDDDLHLCEVL